MLYSQLIRSKRLSGGYKEKKKEEKREMGYRYPEWFSQMQKTMFRRLLEIAVENNWSIDKLHRVALGNNLSFRYNDMLFDLQRMRYIIQLESSISKLEASKYFDQVLEPHRRENKWSMRRERDYRKLKRIEKGGE
jgi:hypothetical protein